VLELRQSYVVDRLAAGLFPRQFLRWILVLHIVARDGGLSDSGAIQYDNSSRILSWSKPKAIFNLYCFVRLADMSTGLFCSQGSRTLPPAGLHGLATHFVDADGRRWGESTYIYIQYTGSDSRIP
jgi:hypothetical protein